MKFFPTIFFLALAACSQRAPRTETWRWSDDEGGKPGHGMEITRTGSQLAIGMFILDPNKPHDFLAGRRAEAQLQRVESQDMYFTVDMPPARPLNLHLHLKSPLQGDTVQAEIGDADGSSRSPAFELRRVQ
jgi:hypothetical protein